LNIIPRNQRSETIKSNKINPEILRNSKAMVTKVPMDGKFNIDEYILEKSTGAIHAKTITSKKIVLESEFFGRS
jgi:hypothetical protein